ncbi:MAG: C69 family dipeptidase [Candidatus Lokiarchaeota archaeon]|nr:C69 family dipeptidase [Candidatus Lokiarchaeota archaeon]
MCDTLVALGNSTEDGSIIFGKNSDRPFNEVQLITYSPRMSFEKGDTLKCTYIEIPQVSETYAILLSQPYWIWGAEMGANEHGVVIGNEAVYTHEPLRSIGLLGMDLLRLGLERGKTAREAMEIMIDLLEKFGQGGGCAYDDPSWMYHNSFIIADPKEAYVLETADKWWIVEKIKNMRSISNGITIRGKGDFRKKGIIEYAIEKKYCKNKDQFDFAETFSGSPISTIPSPYSRGGKTSILLNENIGKITPKLMMDFLREHQAGICMHGGFESTGSQVSHLRNGKKSIHWFTGTTLPCVSIYKPYAFPVEGQKYYNPGPYQIVNSDWFWCKHTTSKPINKKSELRRIELSFISKISGLIQQEDKISEEKFQEKLKFINLEAWNKSYEMLN